MKSGRKLLLVFATLIFASFACYAESKIKCVVPFGFVVGPDGVLERFKIYQPGSCDGVRKNLNLSEAWKRTACVQFSMFSLRPTYSSGEPVSERYATFFFDAERPDVLFLKADSGNSPENPVVYVDESIMESEGKHLCHGNLDATPK